ncbi:hypothetical protein ACS0TY_011945 [Phlomoides rotata]
MGRVVLAGSKRTQAVGSNTVLEALTLRYGLRKAADQPHQAIIAEIDSLVLVRALKGELRAKPYSMLIIGDIIYLVPASRCSNFVYVTRNANKVAYYLAHYGMEDGFEELWTVDLPT